MRGVMCSNILLQGRVRHSVRAVFLDTGGAYRTARPTPNESCSEKIERTSNWPWIFRPNDHLPVWHNGQSSAAVRMHSSKHARNGDRDPRKTRNGAHGVTRPTYLPRMTYGRSTTCARLIARAFEPGGGKSCTVILRMTSGASLVQSLIAALPVKTCARLRDGCNRNGAIENRHGERVVE
jgi:hypothetical protein